MSELKKCRICEGVGQPEIVGGDQPNPWIECQSCGETARVDSWQREPPVESPMRQERDRLKLENTSLDRQLAAYRAAWKDLPSLVKTMDSPIEDIMENIARRRGIDEKEKK